MGTKSKTTAELDGMIEHVRYEVLQTIQFAFTGNLWCSLLEEDLAALTRRSLLEAALIHFRCLIEFLGEQPKSDQVMARDYVKGWDWKIGEQLQPAGDLHGRIAHLGVARLSVAGDGDFDWYGWLQGQAPLVLAGFREFLLRLSVESEYRHKLFRQPRPSLPIVDLPAVLAAMLD